jgi:cell wall-associated NlpC family hydrolase
VTSGLPVGVESAAAAAERPKPTRHSSEHAVSRPLVGERASPISLGVDRLVSKRNAAKRAALEPTLGERAATIAVKAVGVPYRWGGSSLTGGFDCSGLIYWAYGRLGIELPHSSYALYQQGRWVARSGLREGDVLFFSGLGHVGLYIGGGRMVHAPQSGRLVEIVRLGNSNYGLRLVGARRVIPA